MSVEQSQNDLIYFAFERVCEKMFGIYAMDCHLFYFFKIIRYKTMRTCPLALSLLFHVDGRLFCYRPQQRFCYLPE